MLTSGGGGHSRHKKRKEATNMKKLFALAFLALFVSVPSFAAGGVVTRSAKTAATESVKAAKYAVTTTGHAGRAIVKHLF
jgi:hypothetical protein